MRRTVIGTAGHVDHGKTSLVRALTGVDTDRLPEEKRRGISIELGFARFAPAAQVDASIVDVPGHSGLVHTMIAGASGIDLVLLVVAVDEGVMPQTREHVAVCAELGLRRAIVVLSKMDVADFALADLAEAEVREQLGPSLSIAGVVRASARTGQGIEALRAAIAGELVGMPLRPASAHPRLAIDRVFTVTGIGTVVTGTLVEGRVAVGDPLFLVHRSGALGTWTAARALHVHDVAVEEAVAPTRLAINLAGIERTDVHRGDVVTRDATLRSRRAFDVAFASGPAVSERAQWMVHAGTGRAPASLSRFVVLDSLHTATRVSLDAPLVVRAGDRVLLRGTDRKDNRAALLAGATVVDAAPRSPRQRAARALWLAAARSGDAAGVLSAVARDAEPRSILASSLLTRFPIAAADMAAGAARLISKGSLVEVAGAYVARDAALQLSDEARRLVREHLEATPLARGLPLETLRARLAGASDARVAELALSMARAPRSPDDREMIALEGDVATIRALAIAVNPEAAAQAARVARSLAEAGGRGITEFTMRESAGVSSEVARTVLARLVRDRGAVQTGDLWFDAQFVERIRSRVLTHLRSAGRLSVIDFKAISGVARKQAILLLEHFDRAGFTRRVGEARELVGTPTPKP